MTDYANFFLNTSGEVAEIECFEFSHPSFSKVYRFQLYSPWGLTVKHEDGQSYIYDYCPLQVDHSSDSDDLDQGLSITLGDLGDELPLEFDHLADGPYSNVYPTLKRRLYRSDNLNVLMESVITLSTEKANTSPEGVTTFEAVAPKLNNTKTGELYTLARFPTLRGFM